MHIFFVVEAIVSRRAGMRVLVVFLACRAGGTRICEQ